jgi:hypothetical protein
MRLRDVAEALDAEVLTGADKLDIEVAVACACDLMSDVLAFGVPREVLLTGLTNVHVVNTARVLDIPAVIFVRGKRPNGDVVEAAEAEGIVLLSTPLTMFESAGVLYARGLSAVPGPVPEHGK